MSIKHKLSYEVLAQQYAQEQRERNQAKGIKETLQYIRDYADAFVLEGDEVTQSIPHIALIQYFVAVLKWLFQHQTVGVVSDFMFYLPDDEESKIGPEVAVVDGLVVATSNPQISYEVGIDGPPPRVTFEFASKSTWDNDVTIKLGKYASLGVKEYFAFDPNPQQVWQGEWLERGRLIGWRLNPQTSLYQEIEKDAQGRLQTIELQGWLKAESELGLDNAHNSTESFYLRLYDLEGRLRLTEAAAERERAERAEDALSAERQRVQELEALVQQLKQQP